MNLKNLNEELEALGAILERAKNRQWTGLGCVEQLCQALELIEKIQEEILGETRVTLAP